jgi:hypothetical protein
VLLVGTLVSGVRAGAQSDLQGRLLRRSDGATFIYKDGFKYAVQQVDLSDELIDAIPDGVPDSLDQLFASTQPPAGAQPLASPSAAPVAAPSGQVTSSSEGQVQLDKDGVTTVVIKVSPPQPSTGPILSVDQADLASGGVYTWKEVSELPAAGKATQITDAPFITNRHVGTSLLNFHGILVAMTRPDASVSLFFLTRSTPDETPAVEAMLASLEQ